MDYKKAYAVLFNAITDALDEFDTAYIAAQDATAIVKILQTTQQTTEEMYVEA